MALQTTFPAATAQFRNDGMERAWLLLLLAAALGSSFTFACVTPFSTFAVLTAATLPWRRALSMMAAIWLANQLLGYVALGYPLDGASVSWGAAIAIAALFATVAAVATFRLATPLWLKIPLALLAAIAAYEAPLFLVSLAWGGSENFTPDIVAKLALSDAGWLLGLGILRYWLVAYGRVLARAGLAHS